MVDDNAPILEFSLVALTAAGYRATPFENGNEAVAAASKLLPDGRPHLLVLDVLGEPGGQETLAGLRAVGVDAPVLWATGYAPELFGEEEPASQPLLKKPFTATQLVERVGQVLGVGGD
jgi:DNA-binding response OmpR family regulator